MDASVDTATSGVATVQSSTESGVSAMTALAMAREGRTVAATANETMVTTAGAVVGTAAAATTRGASIQAPLST